MLGPLKFKLVEIVPTLFYAGKDVKRFSLVFSSFKLVSLDMGIGCGLLSPRWR